jgi:hypothetical protein
MTRLTFFRGSEEKFQTNWTIFLKEIFKKGFSKRYSLIGGKLENALLKYLKNTNVYLSKFHCIADSNFSSRLVGQSCFILNFILETTIDQSH